MRVFEADGVKIVKLDYNEQGILRDCADLLAEIQDIDGDFYMFDEDEGAEELRDVINAVEGVDFTIIEEITK